MNRGAWQAPVHGILAGNSLLSPAFPSLMQQPVASYQNPGPIQSLSAQSPPATRPTQGEVLWLALRALPGPLIFLLFQLYLLRAFCCIPPWNAVSLWNCELSCFKNEQFPLPLLSLCLCLSALPWRGPALTVSSKAAASPSVHLSPLACAYLASLCACCLSFLISVPLEGWKPCEGRNPTCHVHRCILSNQNSAWHAVHGQ